LKSTATDDDDPWAASHCSSCTHYKGQALISWKRSGSQTRRSKIRCSADKPDIIRDINRIATCQGTKGTVKC
jgi:hypothetical protein